MKKYVLFFVFFYSVTISAFLNEKLLVKEGGLLSKEKFVLIQLSDKFGNELKNAEEFRKNSNIYISLTPTEDWDIGSIKNEKQIKIFNRQYLSYRILKPTISGKVKCFIWEIDKDDFDFTEDFYLENEFSRTQSQKFPEEYWDNYEIVVSRFNYGKKLFGENKYLEAFNNFSFFIKNEYTQDFSFYDKTIELSNRLIGNYIQSQKNKSLEYLTIEKKIKQDAFNFDNTILAAVDSFSIDLEQAIETFTPYFDSDFENSKKHKEDLKELYERFDFQARENYKLYNENILNFFILNDYTYSKFNCFLDLTTRSLCHLDSIRTIDSLTVLSKEILAEYPESLQHLKIFEWEDDLYKIFDQINCNITHDKIIFQSYIMKHLNTLIEEEPRPYYYIFSAFNALGSNNTDSLLTNLDFAIAKCTDPDLLSSLFFLKDAVRSSQMNISEKVYESINKGLKHERSKQYELAEMEYKKATNWSQNFALPLFYLGRNSYIQGKKATSDIYFDKALQIDPSHLESRLFRINILLEREDYDLVLQNVDIALESNPIWFLYFQKAKALFAIEKYELAEKMVLENCIKLNKHNIEELILLGNIYKATGKIKQARSYYKKAGDLDPENQMYIDCINNLK